MIHEDPVSPELATRAEANARAALVHAEALSALGAAWCESPTLFVTLVAKELRAVHVGEDAGFKVFALDATGNVRTGPTGPMTAGDVVAGLVNEYPEFFTKKRTPYGFPRSTNRTKKNVR